ncbi:MAG TPA: peptidoglycan binding domain-containing protein [Thermomicrobiaceae bacterium]|nr:peptidoglycan binding domain-containing protein [Thermomicrobiaceae bacterium]
MAGRVLDDHTSTFWINTRPTPHLAITRAVLGAMAALAAVVVLLATVLLVQGWRYRDRIDPGVQAGGIALGGLSQERASALLAVRLPDDAPQQLVLTSSGKSWAVPSARLNVRYDAERTAAQAFALGHAGNLWSDSADLLSAWLGGSRVPVAFSVDQQASLDALRALAPEVARRPVDASYVFDSSGKLTIDPGSTGIGIDTAATYGAMERSVAALSTAPVAIETVTLPQKVEAGDLKRGLDAATALVGQPVSISFGSDRWEIAPAALRTMLEPGATSQAAPTLSRERLTAYLGQLDGAIKRAGVDAGVNWDGKAFAVVPGQDAQAFDPAATAGAILSALGQGQHRVEAVTQSHPPAITDADARAAAEQARQLVAKPFTVTWDSGSLPLPADVIGQSIGFQAHPNQSPKLALTIDPVELTQALGGIKDKIEKPAKDAQFRYLDGAVKVVAPEQAGVTLDLEKSAAAVRDALLKGSESVAIVTQPVEPKYTAAMASSIAIKDKLGSGQTSYAGSIANRAYNVELAVSRVNGALVPPGATFSFTGTIGAVDLNNGYKLGYGIATTNGNVTTVPSVGGGICQVATTLFHAAWWAGMPIVDRSWHLYWIPNYGVSPSGVTGLDATVDTDAGLDFKFKNTTGNWLAVVASADGSWVRFSLWGIDPHWKVQSDDPVITDVVKADTTMKYEKGDSLPKGQSILLEHAEDGFDVTLHRQVFSGDKRIDDLTLKSHYVPSENITLVGTG